MVGSLKVRLHPKTGFYVEGLKVSRHNTWHGGKPKGATAPKDRLLCGGFEGESPQNMGRWEA